MDSDNKMANKNGQSDDKMANKNGLWQQNGQQKWPV